MKIDAFATSGYLKFSSYSYKARDYDLFLFLAEKLKLTGKIKELKEN